MALSKYEDDIPDHVSPHALEGDARDSWLDRLWGAFLENATNGVVSLHSLQSIAEDLRVEGEENFLERSIPKEKWQLLTFEDATKYLDDMSRSASEEYALEGDGKLIGAGAGGQPPGGALGASGGVGGELTAADMDAKLEDKRTWFERAEARWRSSRLRQLLQEPKVTLLVSTVALMVAVGIALMVAISVTWSRSARDVHEQQVENIHVLTHTLFASLEKHLLDEMGDGLLSQSKLFATWTQKSEILAERNQLTLMRIRTLSISSGLAALLNIERYGDEGDAVLSALKTIEGRVGSNASAASAVIALTNVSTLQTRFPQWNVSNCSFFSAADAAAGLVPASQVIPFTDGTLCGQAHADRAPFGDESLRVVQNLSTFLNASGSGARLSLLYVNTTQRNGQPVVRTLSIHNSTVPAQACLGSAMLSLCNDTLARIDTTASVGGTTQFIEANFYFNDSHASYVAPIDPKRTLVAVSMGKKTAQQSRYDQVVAFVNAFVGALDASVPTVANIALRNPTTDVVVPMANTPFAAAQCLISGACALPRSTRSRVVNVLSNGTTALDGWEALPDARPVASLTAFAYSRGSIELVTFLQAEIAVLRKRSLDRLVKTLDALNTNTHRVGSSLEVLFDSQTLSATSASFFAYDPCPTDVFCVVDPRGATAANNSKGVLFRHDCRDCARTVLPYADQGAAIIMTHLQGRATYPQQGCFTRTCMAPAAKAAVREVKDKMHRTRRTPDYDLNDVIAVVSHVANLSGSIITKVDDSELWSSVGSNLGIAIGVSVAILLLGIAVLYGSASENFRDIDSDWAHFRAQIEREKERFANLVKGYIPPHIVERLVGGNRLLVDQTHGACFAFIDICGFSTESRGWQPKEVGRHLNYCMYVMEEVAAEHGVLKLRTVGDLFCAVALRADSTSAIKGAIGAGRRKSQAVSVGGGGTDEEDELAQHPVRRGIDTCALLMMLFSPHFEHYPQANKHFRDIFKEKIQDGRPTVLPQLRIGVHVGVAVGGAFSIGNISHYDFFGPGPALANRMQQTSAPGRVHVTNIVKELLRPRDPDRMYTFDSARKTIVRGQGAITSYFLKSLHIPVPASLLEPLGIRRATQRVDFTVKRQNLKRNTSSGTDMSEKAE